MIFNQQKQEGFTLVELSIVIVIIGLIAAGVIAGQSLISQSQLRAVVSELNEIEKSLMTFRLNFNNAIPGDFRKAHDYWGNDCSSTASFCNGNGDRKVIPRYQSDFNLGSSNDPEDRENIRFWQHLKLANILNRNFNGIATNDGGGGVNDSNSYVSKLRGGIYGAHYTNRNYLYMGRNVGGFTQGGILNPREMRSIDIKFDNGLSGGKLTGWNDGAQCSPAGTNNEYNIDVTDEICYLVFAY